MASIIEILLVLALSNHFIQYTFAERTLSSTYYYSVNQGIVASTENNGNQIEIVLGSLNDEKIMAVWASDGNVNDSDKYGIFMQRFEKDLTKSGSETKVNDNIVGNQSNPDLSVSSDKFCIVWESENQVDHSQDIYGEVFNNGQNTFKPDFIVPDTTTGDQKNPAVAGIAGGSFAVVWESYEAPYTNIYGAIIKHDATKTPEFLVNTDTDDDKSGPAVAGFETGNFIVVWRSATQNAGKPGIYAQIFDSTGSRVGSEFLVNTYSSTYVMAPAVAVYGNQKVAVVWDGEGEGDDRGVYCRRFENNGIPLDTSEFLVNAEINSDQESPKIAGLGDGTFVIAYTSSDNGDNDIYAQVLRDDLTYALDEVKINTNAPAQRPYVTNIVSLGFVIAWDDGEDVFIGASNACESPACKDCSNSIGQCDLCDDEYEIDNNSCVYCGNSCSSGPCPNGKDPSVDDGCDCPSGSFDSGTSTVECTLCKDGCAVCTTITNCDECNHGRAPSATFECTCSTGYYDDGQNPLSCLECPTDCLECTGVNMCTLCSNSLELENGVCVCPEYHIMVSGSCVYKVLTFTVSQFDDHYQIEFNEDLNSQFQSNNLGNCVSLPGNEDLSFSVSYVSMKVYELRYASSVPQTATSFECTLVNVRGANNEELLNSKLESEVIVTGQTEDNSGESTEETGDGNQETEEENGETGEENGETEDENGETEDTNKETEEDADLLGISPDTLGSVAMINWVISSAGIGFISASPSLIWTMINTGALLFYIPLQNTGVPRPLQSFFQTFDTSFNGLIPNLGSLVGIQDDNYTESPKLWRDYGILSTSLLINTGNTLFSSLVLLSFLPISILILVSSRRCPDWWKNYFRRRVLDYKWGFFLRFWIQIYLDLLAACLLSTGSVMNK